MAVECAAVLIMLLAMSIVIRQKGNRGADLAMIPLYFMPAIYLAAGFAARYLPADGPIQPVPFRHRNGCTGTGCPPPSDPTDVFCPCRRVQPGSGCDLHTGTSGIASH